MARSFRGQAGRPFGTVAALLVAIFTLALLTLGRVGYRLTGASLAVRAGDDPALVAPMSEVWGVFLAAEIVHAVAALALLLAVWTLAGPIGPRTPRRDAAVLVGTLAALLMLCAARQGIVIAAHLSVPEVVSRPELIGFLARAAMALTGVWAVLIALEARRAQSLPRWVRDAAMLFCVTALAALAIPVLYGAAALISLFWWGGVFAMLYKPEDRALS